jgi:opacity protein-like surface antigen
LFDFRKSLMKCIASLFIGAVLASVSTSALADPWKDESGHGRYGRYGGGEYKEEYWDGHCKVKRKWDGDEYKEERKCKRPRRAVVIEPPLDHPSVIIDPYGVVIQPPPIIIR